MSDWLGWLREARASGEPGALITVMASEGSAPRGAGTRMLVTAGATRGTIGGGALEYQAVAQARLTLAEPAGHWRVQDYPLGPLLGQCCGGRVRLLIEHVDPAGLGWLAAAHGDRALVATLTATHVERVVAKRGAAPPVSARGARPGAGTCFVETLGGPRRPLVLFGAGHVGQAVARHAAGLPLALAWFDPRSEYAGIDGVTTVAEDALPDCLADAPADAAVVVMTHDHGLDYRLTRAALDRAPAFVGLIGSTTKRARFAARLAADGVAAAAIAGLACPIGVAGVTGNEPDVIAVATLAQLLALPRPA